jgi:hypothetical protein
MVFYNSCNYPSHCVYVLTRHFTLLFFARLSVTLVIAHLHEAMKGRSMAHGESGKDTRGYRTFINEVRSMYTL